MRTYNQIISDLRGIARSHAQVASFGDGELWEANGNPRNAGSYPELWCVPVSAEVGENTLVYTLRLLCYDLVSPGEENERDVLSDTLQVLSDVVRTLRWNADAHEEYAVLGSPLMEPFTERLSDSVSGWSGEVRLEVSLGPNDCDVPTDV